MFPNTYLCAFPENGFYGIGRRTRYRTNVHAQSKFYSPFNNYCEPYWYCPLLLTLWQYFLRAFGLGATFHPPECQSVRWRAEWPFLAALREQAVIYECRKRGGLREKRVGRREISRLASNRRFNADCLNAQSRLKAVKARY